VRILIITPSLPYPPNWGFGIRVYQIARLLARTHDVALLTYTAPGQEEHVAALRAQGVDVHAVPSSNPHNRKQERRREQMLSLASPVSYLTRSLYSRAMQQEIDRLLAEKQFDIVQMESTHLASFDLSKAGCVVVDEHNIEYELLYRMYKSERSPWRRLFNWAEYVKFRREERRCWDHACALVLTSDREREIIAATWPGKAPVTVAPNGVDVEYFAPSAEPIDPNSLVYTGLMRYRPNIDAVVYFATEILPLIRQRRPDATFTIVGAGPSIDVRELASDHVIVTGSVPDVRPYVARAAVNVVPCAWAAAPASRSWKVSRWRSRWCRPPSAAKASTSTMASTC